MGCRKNCSHYWERIKEKEKRVPIMFEGKEKQGGMIREWRKKRGFYGFFLPLSSTPSTLTLGKEFTVFSTRRRLFHRKSTAGGGGECVCKGKNGIKNY